MTTRVFSAFASPEITLTELKQFMGGAIVELSKQVNEQVVDVKAEIGVLKTLAVTGQSDLTVIKQAVEEIDAQSKKLTLLKLISYSGALSFFTSLSTFGLGWAFWKTTLTKVPASSGEATEAVLMVTP